MKVTEWQKVDRSYDSIQDLTYVWQTKCVKLKVSDFILKTTFSRMKLCVETKYDIKNAKFSP